jgi:hypothetical protein
LKQQLKRQALHACLFEREVPVERPLGDLHQGTSPDISSSRQPPFVKERGSAEQEARSVVLQNRHGNAIKLSGV